MWWENLVVLEALCRTKTMARAARELHIDKATVSRRIAELERAAPGPLFERRAGQLELTPYGARALTAFAEHERSKQRLACELEHADAELAGSVRVTVPAFFACGIIVPALRAFLAEHPQISVQIDGSNRVRDLARAEADVAIRNLRPSEGGLDVRKVGRLGMALYASHSYLARRGGLIAPHRLTGHELLSYDTGPYAGPGFEWLPQAAQQARLAFSANDAFPLRDAARAGLGLATLPHFLGDEAAELVRVPGGGEGATDIWVVTRAEQKRVPRIRRVVQFVTEVVRANQQRLYAPRPTGESSLEYAVHS
jgi:DNA-binding transcriptional LysR family regulator